MQPDLRARVSRRVRPILATGGTLAVVAVIGLGVMNAHEPTRAARHEALKNAIQMAIMADMTIIKMPPGSSPGHMSPQAVTELRDRLTRDLPRIHTGELLTVKLQRLSGYVDAAASSDSIAEATGAGITSFTMSAVRVSGSHATVHGSYAVWATGRHKADTGRLEDDRSESQYTFTAGLDQVDGRWLVSSWDGIQVG